MNRGLAYADSGEKELAIADFTYLIDKDSPYAADGYINRSGLNENCDDPQKFSNLQTALELSPLDGSIAFGFADMECEKYSEATKHFQRAVDLLPDKTFLYDLLGRARLYSGQTEAAKEAYCQMLPYLYEDGERQMYISILNMIVIQKPELETTIKDIKEMLTSGNCA